MHKSSKIKLQMKSFFHNIRIYGLKSVFFRYFFSSLAIVFIIFTPLIFITTSYYNYAITKEISVQAMASTNKSKSVFDVLTTEFFRNYDITRNNSAVKSFLDLSEITASNESSVTHEVYTTIIPLLKSSSYIQDIYIYSIKSKYMISSHTQKNILPDLKPEWLKTYDALRVDYFMIPRKTSGSQEYNVIYTCQTIREKGEIIGLFCTEMRYNQFEDLVNKAFTENPDRMYIVNDLGLILYNENPEQINTSVYLDADAAPIFNTTKKITDSTFLQENYLISLARDEKSHLIIMSYLDKSKLLGGFSGVFPPIILMVLGALASAILLALFFSFQHYRSVMQVLNSLENPDTKNMLPKKLNEIYQISDSIINIAQSNQTILNELSEKANNLKEAQIAALQAQINPHFLFNALQLINLSIIKEVRSDNTATHFISDLSDLLRTTYDTENYIVPIEEEIEVTRKYLSIQQARYKTHLRVHYDIDPACLKINTVKLVLQPLVENSIVHGFKGKTGYWNIDISCRKDDQSIIFQVSDDGYGMAPDVLEDLRRTIESKLVNRRSSIGIANVFQRIRLVYGSSVEIQIHSQPDFGTSITIRHSIDVP